jgi:DNA repair protein RadD
MFESLGLFDYELSDVLRIADAFHRVRRVLYTLPTGGGKTHVAVAHIITARRRGERILFLAHRRELVNQAAKRLIRAGVPECDIGVIMAGDRRACALSPVQVASVDTVRRRNKPDADFIIVDECHRVMSPTYRSLLALYPNAKVLGLTATPFRLDGKGLRAEFDEIVVGCSPQELIEHGQLVTSRVFTVPDELLPVLKDVRIVAGDYNQGQLGKVMNRRPLVASIVQEYKRLGEDRAAVVFSSGREHARVIQAEFAEAGYAAEYLDGDTPVADRDAMLARLRDGATRVLVNCDVLVEGWDAPWVKCVILARPTRSLGRYLQMVGRVLRRYRGETALVLDHAGNARMHGLPDQDRREGFTLDGRHSVAKQSEAPLKRCPECGMMVATGFYACPNCGHDWLVEPVPDVVSADLVEVVKRPPRTCSRCGLLLGANNRSGLCKKCGNNEISRQKRFARTARKLATKESATCPECGAPFLKEYHAVGGRPRAFCSTKCGWRASKRAWRCRHNATSIGQASA